MKRTKYTRCVKNKLIIISTSVIILYKTSDFSIDRQIFIAPYTVKYKAYGRYHSRQLLAAVDLNSAFVLKAVSIILNNSYNLFKKT